MLEYFAYKKFKKNKAEKAAAAAATSQENNASSSSPAPGGSTSSPAPGSPSSRTPSSALATAATPLLTADDERFLERLTSPTTDTHNEEDESPRPPLPPRIKTPDLTWDSDSESFVKPQDKTSSSSAMGTAKDKAKAGINRVSLFLKSKSPSNNNKQLAVPSSSTGEATREEDDLTRVLDDLNLAARNNKVFALSADANELVRRFTLVLKDLVNGVPTAVNDLTSLLDDRDGVLSKNYEKLPSSLKKLVTQLPDKLSESLAPEILATAAAAQGVSAEEAKKGGIKGAAKRMLIPKNLKELVTKPGAVVSMLKGIMNALKLRWPAFMGTNVIWSLALFLLLFVLWYCHKRGREVRLDKEKGEREEVVDGTDRVEELPDDPTLPAPPPEGSGSGSERRRRGEGGRRTETTVPVVVEPEEGGDGSRRRRRSRD